MISQVTKLDLLRKSTTQVIANGQSRRTPSIQASLLWALFDVSSSSAPVYSSDVTTSSTVELATDTQFLLPLENVNTPRTHSTPHAPPSAVEHAGTDIVQEPGEPSEPFFADQLDLFDPELLADFHTSAFGESFYADFGQF